MALKFSHAVGYRGSCILYPITDSHGNQVPENIIERDEEGRITSDAPINGIGQARERFGQGQVPLLCTGGNINLTQDPIMGSGVWGAGYANAAPIAYAWNYLNLEGSANFELTKGPVWMAINEYAFLARTRDHWITLLPDGTTGFCGPGWLSSLGFDASEGAALNGNFNFKGDPGDTYGSSGTGNSSGNDNVYIHAYYDEDYAAIRGYEQNAVGAHGQGLYDSGSGSEGPTQYPDDNSLLYPNDPGGPGKTPRELLLAGATLIPYWMTCCGYYDVKEQKSFPINDVISWSCSYNSDIQMLKCCNLQGTAPISADYVLLGEMSGDGNYTVFRIAGNFKPKRYHEEKRYLTFGIRGTSKKEKLVMDVTSNGDVYNCYQAIQIPLAIVNSASTSMTTGASYVTSQYSFTALGDGLNGVMRMSDGSGLNRPEEDFPEEDKNYKVIWGGGGGSSLYPHSSN